MHPDRKKQATVEIREKKGAELVIRQRNEYRKMVS